MTDLLPCCQCGKNEGYNLGGGDTYRWWRVYCNACGGDFGECDADRTVNLQNQPLPSRWKWADEHWNQCNSYAQTLRDCIANLSNGLDTDWTSHTGVLTDE